MTRPHVRAAFFDVDETLIAVKSMVGFLRHHYAAIGRPPSAFAEVVEQLRGLTVRGASRAEVSRAYYRSFVGRSAAELAAQGRAWFERERRRAGLFIPAGVRAFRRHQRDGDLTVLVSGSFAACLDPIAEWLGADLAVGAQPEVVDGVHTGHMHTVMIGADKAVAARSVTRRYGIVLADCHAYGDHASDLPLLEAVGHPVVVGDDPVLARRAAAGGWPRIPGVVR